MLPALPAELAAGSVSGLVARPGITVDIRWERGAAVELSLTPRHAAASGPHTVCIGGWTGSVELRSAIARGWSLPARSFTFPILTHAPGLSWHSQSLLQQEGAGTSAPRPDSGPDDCANAESQGEADKRAVKDCKAQGDSDGGAHEATDPQRLIHWT